MDSQEEHLPNRESINELEKMEIYLQVFHHFLPQAMDFPNLAVPYTLFLRSLREKLHPVGVRDVQAVNLPSGLTFHVDVGDRLGCDFYYGHYQEYFDAQLFLGLLDANSIVLDVGANFGYYAVSSATKLTPTGCVHAFEPNPDAYQLLQQNVEVNHLQQLVSCHDLCVGAEDGETDFYITQESAFSGMDDTKRSVLREKISIPVCSLDSILSELGLSQIDAIKIDVEGSEFAVLNGAIETIQRSPNIVIMMEVSAKNLNEHRREALMSSLVNLYNQNLRGWIVDSNPRVLKSIPTPEAALTLGSATSANLFLMVSGSEREHQLSKVYHNLQTKEDSNQLKEPDIAFVSGL
ncbi:MAG: FkbM family methyltransferase [Moorea sp. SIO3C2]|nr:FkbM family methyltransferase [Moorena sp. SIO3C2]